MPFFFSEPEDLTKSNGTTPWRSADIVLCYDSKYLNYRDIVLKAIDLWIHRSMKSRLPYDPDELEEDSSIIEDGDDNNNDDRKEEERPCRKGLPHDESLCEMCEIYNRNCTKRPTSN